MVENPLTYLVVVVLIVVLGFWFIVVKLPDRKRQPHISTSYKSSEKIW